MARKNLANHNFDPMTKRRDFIKGVSMTSIAMALSADNLLALTKKRARMKLGFVTYLWGKDWDLPTIIQNCEKTGIYGVELRTQHKHGVEPSLTAAERKEVKNRFAASRVKLLGYGSNVEFDSPDQAILKRNMDEAKALVKLSHDVGGSGVKVKPNQFHEGVSHEKTLEQIGKSLNEIGAFGKDYGQQIRLEVHGRGTQELPNIKAIMDVADNRNVAVCWNCNPTDLNGEGFDHNFNLVKDRLGDTMHIHEMNVDSYPFPDLMKRLVEIDYPGWTLLECSSNPQDKVQAMIEQRALWEKLVAEASK